MTELEIKEQENKKLLEALSHLEEVNDPIDDSLYKQFDVKRGLRYADGRGVLVGLTRIGDVVGYELDSEGKKVAVPGKLIYRGYNIEDIVKDCVAHNQFGFEQCVYLLLFGELPTHTQLKRFTEFLGEYRGLPENFTEDMIMKAPSCNIMNKIESLDEIQDNHEFH